MALDIERELALLVLWMLFASSIIQSIIHWITWWVLRQQQTITSVGPAVNRRELTLALKTMARSMIDLTLAVLVTWSRWIFNMETREVLYFITSLFALAAIWYGIVYLLALNQENFGQPDQDCP